MAKCRSENGKVKLIRNKPSTARYVGTCEDCGLVMEPDTLNMTVFSLDVHYGKKV